MTTEPHSRELKVKFAIELLKEPNDPFAAALKAFGDAQQALIASRTLIHDPEIEQLKQDALAEFGAEAFLPSKEQLARDIYNVATGKWVDDDDRIKGFKLYAEVMGWLNKGGTVINNNNSLVDNRSVMVVKDHGTDEQWEEAARLQQAKLIENAAV